MPCAFCRSEPTKDDKAIIDRLQGRAEKNDANAMNSLSEYYSEGQKGLPKDEVVALSFDLRAAELGSLSSIGALAGHFYDKEDDPQNAVFAMQLATIAAKKGDLSAYGILACFYNDHGDVESAAKSWIFAARAGCSESMEVLRKYKVNGARLVSDDDLEAIEEAYKDAAKLEWSEEREAFKKLHSIK